MPRLSVYMIRASLLHFGIGFTLGGLILFEKGVPYDTTMWRLRPMHIEMALIGWTMQLAMGVAFWILPRFSWPRGYGRRTPVWIAFVLLNLGVVSAGVGQWSSHLDGLTLAGRLIEFLAVVAFAIGIWPRVKPLSTQAGQKS